MIRGEIRVGKDREEIRKEIEEFLKFHSENYFTCAIATCNDNIPRNTPVDYRPDGLSIWFVCDSGGKIKNIESNPKVCVAIFVPLGKGRMKDARGLQMWGTARIIKRAENEEDFNYGAKIFNLENFNRKQFGKDITEEQLNKIIFINVIPNKISFLDGSKGVGYKLIWTE